MIDNIKHITKREEEMYNDIMDVLYRASKLEDKPHLIWNGIRLLALKYLEHRPSEMKDIVEMSDRRYLAGSEKAIGEKLYLAINKERYGTPKS